MHISGNHIDLNSAEIGSLWPAFMNDDMNKYVLEYFLQHIEDNDIKK